MSRPSKRFNFPKVVTVLAVTFGVALGACGLTAFATNNGGANNLLLLSMNELLLLGVIELAVMALAAVGLVLTVILWVLTVAIGNR